MSRPHLPNSFVGERVRFTITGSPVAEDRRPWRTTHIAQESRREMKIRKRTEAVERQAAWAALSKEEKLAILDRRQGASRRQRERLAK